MTNNATLTNEKKFDEQIPTKMQRSAPKCPPLAGHFWRAKMGRGIINNQMGKINKKQKSGNTTI